MNVSKVIRNSVAGALIAAMPVSTTVAAVRPNAAVPTAGATAVTAAQYDDDAGAMGVSWAALAVIAITIAVAIYFLVDDDPDGEGSISPGG